MQKLCFIITKKERNDFYLINHYPFAVVCELLRQNHLSIQLQWTMGAGGHFSTPENYYVPRPIG